MIKGNKGEWSEFYTFLKLLDSRRIFFADANLNKLDDKYYPIINIIREETTLGKRVYDLSDSKKIIISDGKGSPLGNVDIKKVKQGAANVLKKMQTSSGSFAVTGVEGLFKELKCSQIKSSSYNKGDIVLTVSEAMLPMSVSIGFSIKSMLGSPATLLNASGSTNFIYQVKNFKGSIEKINKINSKSKVRDRVRMIELGGGDIIFDSLASDKFNNNLKKIDVVFAEIIATALKYFYQGKGSTMPEISHCLYQDKLLKEKYSLSENDFEFKIKTFLKAMALGMVPSRAWDGLNIAQGGYLIVKENGDVLCYHLYNIDAFADYLFKNTKLDTPSTSRHGFGEIYKKDNKLFINLNLQIRFIK